MDRTSHPNCTRVMMYCTLERFVRTGPVIQEQQDAGADLNSEEKQRDTAQEVPVRELVNGDGLMTQGLS
jgi:hypothetical protein